MYVNVCKKTYIYRTEIALVEYPIHLAQRKITPQIVYFQTTECP